ncbi:MAG: hypothetical protein GWN97_09810 [Thermoplasmata archaeon]|nr:hypothetical protein [Thermoplasmata archaeon]NIS12190.1 hypothetical protein [Thermoplasmata archaeon]NIT77430.1 hypothetical protein [Thermoplasmata archaeon]NIY03801.1 hypothetical protein [Thermoplasmata archaeon]
MLDGEKVKDVASWGRFCFDVADHTFGTGDNFVQVRWTFSKAGVPIKLVPGESINFIINDNLSTLVAHTFAVQGYTEPM